MMTNPQPTRIARAQQSIRKWRQNLDWLEVCDDISIGTLVALMWVALVAIPCTMLLLLWVALKWWSILAIAGICVALYGLRLIGRRVSS